MSIGKHLFHFLFSKFAQPRVLRTWEQADINRINRERIIIPCPYCGHSQSEFILRWTITNHFGLFDNDEHRLNVLYGRKIKYVLPRSALLAYRVKALDLLRGRSYVDYRRCLACGLIFQNFPHEPSAKKFYYRHLYRLAYALHKRHRNAGCDEGLFGRDNPDFAKRKESIAKYFLYKTRLEQGAKILDVGCAEGIVCRYFVRKGLVAYGIEPSEQMVNYAKRKLQLDNITCDALSPDTYAAEFFDGIVTHHVLEHVVDIRVFFVSISRCLKLRGYLLLQTPCSDAPTDYSKILLGDHLYAFPERFLRELLVLYGFEILECKKTPDDLSKLDASEVTASGVSIWGDVPYGISILARKGSRGERIQST